MIIQVRGTSGSGKTTVMRAVMKALETEPGEWYGHHAPDRRRPLYYCNRSGVAVLGHYESACGGCDNVGSAAAVAALLRIVAQSEGVKHILCEGLLLSEDVKWTSSIFAAYGSHLRVLFLTTPLDECLTRVKGRRQAAGNEKPLDPSNTANRVAVIERARTKLLAAGVYCRRASSEQAPGLILEWLNGDRS